MSPAILFITATRIGDAVLSTGLLRHLVDRYEAPRFTIVAGPAAAPLFAGVPGVERLIALPKQTFARHWLTLYRHVALKRWDMVIDLRGSALSWLLWTRQRCIIAKGDPGQHRVVQLAQAMGLDPAPAPKIWLRPADIAKAAQLVPPSASPLLAIAPAANWRGKQWPPERFATLVQRLTATDGPMPGASVAVFAAPHERNQALPILNALPAARIYDLLEAGDLLTVAACLARADLFIGNDSGLMHMAASMDVPTLGLFGPSLESHYGPWGEQNAVVRTPESLAELTTATGYHHLTTGSLMTSLTVESVAAVAAALYTRTLCRVTA